MNAHSRSGEPVTRRQVEEALAWGKRAKELEQREQFREARRRAYVERTDARWAQDTIRAAFAQPAASAGPSRGVLVDARAARSVVEAFESAFERDAMPRAHAVRYR